MPVKYKNYTPKTEKQKNYAPIYEMNFFYAKICQNFWFSVKFYAKKLPTVSNFLFSKKFHRKVSAYCEGPAIVSLPYSMTLFYLKPSILHSFPSKSYVIVVISFFCRFQLRLWFHKKTTLTPIPTLHNLFFLNQIHKFYNRPNKLFTYIYIMFCLFQLFVLLKFQYICKFILHKVLVVIAHGHHRLS